MGSDGPVADTLLTTDRMRNAALRQRAMPSWFTFPHQQSRAEAVRIEFSQVLAGVRGEVMRF